MGFVLPSAVVAAPGLAASTITSTVWIRAPFRSKAILPTGCRFANASTVGRWAWGSATSVGDEADDPGRDRRDRPWLVERALRAGHDVTAVVRRREGLPRAAAVVTELATPDPVALERSTAAARAAATSGSPPSPPAPSLTP